MTLVTEVTATHSSVPNKENKTHKLPEIVSHTEVLHFLFQIWGIIICHFLHQSIKYVQNIYFLFHFVNMHPYLFSCY